MMMLALTVMAGATLAQHLGLAGAVAGVASRIAKCPKCCSFWATLAVLALAGCPAVKAVGLALLSAYLSFWFGLALIVLQEKYNSLWEKLTKSRRGNL